MYTMITRLRGLDADQLSGDELIELRATARLLTNEFTHAGYDVPEWLTDKAKTLDREIALRREDHLRKRLRELDAMELSLETPQEKRTRLAEERLRLQTALGIAPIAAVQG